MRNVLSRLFIAGAALVMLGPPVSVSGQVTTASGPGQAPPAGPVRRLSVNEAVQLALEQNLSLQVQRIEPRVQEQAVAQARASYTPTLSSSFTGSNRKSPVSSFLSGAADKLTTNDVQGTVSAAKNLPWGGNVNLSFDSSRTSTNNYFSGFNPALGSSFSFNVAQPLLRNFKIDSVRQQILVSRKNREISDVQLRQTVLGTVRSVKQAYWDLSTAVSSLAVQRQSLDLARESLRNNRARVEIGTMAPIDIIAAEAEVAQREEGVIVAEAALSQAEDRLRTLIFDPNTPDFWRMTLELTDQPTFQAQAIDADAAVSTALAKRTDLQQAKKNLEVSDVNLRYFRDQLRPDLSVQAGYTVMAQGGTKKQFGSGFPPVEIGTEQVSYGNMVGKILGNDFPTWSFGVQFSYPIGTSAGRDRPGPGQAPVHPGGTPDPQPRAAGGLADPGHRPAGEHEPEAGRGDAGRARTR